MTWPVAGTVWVLDKRPTLATETPEKASTRHAIHGTDEGLTGCIAWQGRKCHKNLGDIDVTDIHTQIRNSNRLEALYKQLGATLWRLQELEGMVAQYYVLVALATRGMGITQGLALERIVEGKTFGRTVKMLLDSKRLPSDLIDRLPAIVKERNWLVHSSLADERAAFYNDARCLSLLKRMDDMTREASAIIKMLGNSAESFVMNAGVTAEEIDRLTKQTLEAWRGDTA